MSLDVDLRSVHRCEACGHEQDSRHELFSSNITHNLKEMAREAGVFEHLWFPENIGITRARELVDPLTTAVALMSADPARFKKHDTPNGWGLYKNFLPWIERLLAACIQHPDAFVHVDR